MGAVMSDESAKQLIASGRKRSLRMKGLSFPQAIGDGCVMGDLATLAETALADLARVKSELSVEKAQVVFWERLSQRRSDEWKAAESALAKMTEERDALRADNQDLLAKHDAQALMLAQVGRERDAAESALATAHAELSEAKTQAHLRFKECVDLEVKIATMKAQGTFAEGIEAAAKVAEDAYTRHEKYPEVQCPDARVERGELVYYLEASPDDIAARIRALAPPKPAEEPQS